MCGSPEENVACDFVLASPAILCVGLILNFSKMNIFRVSKSFFG